MKLSQSEIQARLKEVRRSYIASLVEKREAVETQWSILTKQWQPDNYQSLYLIIHSLAGSAETFGLSEITIAARRVIDLFKQHIRQNSLDENCMPLIKADIEQLTARMAAAAQEIEKSPD